MRTILPHAPEHRSQGVFREIVERERLVLTGAWVDAEGKPIRQS
jgi:hypothetical protein